MIHDIVKFIRVDDKKNRIDIVQALSEIKSVTFVVWNEYTQIIHAKYNCIL